MLKKTKEYWKRQFIFWLARRLPDCREMTALFSESLERPTTPREKIVMRLHLYTCGACEHYLAQIKRLQTAARKINEQSPVKLNPEARERITAALKAAAEEN